MLSPRKPFVRTPPQSFHEFRRPFFEFAPVCGIDTDLNLRAKVIQVGTLLVEGSKSICDNGIGIWVLARINPSPDLVLNGLTECCALCHTS